MFLNVELQYLADIAIQQRRTLDVSAMSSATLSLHFATLMQHSQYCNSTFLRCWFNVCCMGYVPLRQRDNFIFSFESRDQYRFVKSGFINKYHVWISTECGSKIDRPTFPITSKYNFAFNQSL